MLYTVECSYSDPQSEDSWNSFYSDKKLPALVSVTGFTTSQRFKALTSGCPIYLAIHTVKDAEVISSEEYRLKGGGNFCYWQSHITDWHRNIYQCNETVPSVSSTEILVLSQHSISFFQEKNKYRELEMLAVGLEKFPPRRLAYVVPREYIQYLKEKPEIFFYEPITVQIKNPHLNSLSKK